MVGSAFGPVGTVVGGVAGGLLGFFSGMASGSDPVPVAPTFADISLAKDNPDLFKRLQDQDAIIREARNMYEARRQGMTAQERFSYGDSMARTGESLNRAGLSGSSDAFAIADEQRRRQDAVIADRVFQEKNALYNQYLQQVDRGYNQNRQAIGDVLDQKNRQFSADNQKLADSNAMWSGLANSGLSNLGRGINMYASQTRPPPQYAMPQGYGGSNFYSGVPGQATYSDNYSMPQYGSVA
jgi:hypothetical protein